MTPTPETQIDLFAWARELEQERERVADANAERASRRGYLVFATDPAISPEQSGYREVYATEAKTPNQAMAKVKPITEGRRLRAYLATGRYREELADARWVA
jgi:ribosomal protein S12